MTSSNEPAGVGEVCSNSLGRGDSRPAGEASISPIEPQSTASLGRATDSIKIKPREHQDVVSGILGTTDYQTAVGPVPDGGEIWLPDSAESMVGKSGDNDQPEPHSAESRRAIVEKACRLSNSHPFTSSDREDLGQELYIAWRSAWSTFDPARGPLQAFRATVLNRAAAKLLNAARAQKRYRRETKSLDRDSIGNGPHRRIEPIYDKRKIPSGQPAMTPERHVALKLDVAEAVAELPEPLADLCKELKDNSIAEIGREWGIPASTLSSRLTAVRSRWCSRRLTEFL